MVQNNWQSCEKRFFLSVFVKMEVWHQNVQNHFLYVTLKMNEKRHKIERDDEFLGEKTGCLANRKGKSGNKAVDVCQQGTSNQPKVCTLFGQKSRWNGAFSASNPLFRPAFQGGKKYSYHRVRQLRKRLKIAQIRRTFGFCISRPLILHRRKARCKLKCCFRLHFVTFRALKIL